MGKEGAKLWLRALASDGSEGHVPAPNPRSDAIANTGGVFEPPSKLDLEYYCCIVVPTSLLGFGSPPGEAFELWERHRGEDGRETVGNGKMADREKEGQEYYQEDGLERIRKEGRGRKVGVIVGKDGMKVRQCGETVWRDSVERQCGETVWRDSVERQCGETVWRDSVERQCGETVWRDSVEIQTVAATLCCKFPARKTPARRWTASDNTEKNPADLARTESSQHLNAIAKTYATITARSRLRHY
ncbi:hypothetical protein LSAT2_018119 [Lamellibrachia satsuma]|nr:hypothetical protein LSAT2_018119 [Lamellibrachia satsuma]